MNILEEAIIFATHAHEGQIRKLADAPYILHPLEVAAIISTITGDQEIMAAGVLHDTVEDCEVDPEEIFEKFGPRVAALVSSETEERVSNKSLEDSWMERKEGSLNVLKTTKNMDVKILWLGDKLSNIRSFYREYMKKGNAIFECLHQKDPEMHKWYYMTIADNLTELKDTAAYKEYVELVRRVFG